MTIASASAASTAVGAQPMVQLAGVTKQYGAVEALRPTNLTVAKGEFVTLLGPSGSGKTTILNLIAGMIQPSAGRVVLDGRDVTTVPANQRGLGMVFQHYALMPHMTVFENIAFPLQVRRIPKDEIKRRVTDVLDPVQLSHVAARRPRELSGGQQQRIALARCIVYSPSLILMDEPLGALDKKLREHMQLEIKRLHAQSGITMLYVTHDQDEALTMSDRIVLINRGKIEQQGPPQDLYHEPSTVFCAEFIGSSNLIPGTIETGGGGTAIRTAHGSFPVPAGHGHASGAPAILLVRPENMTLASPERDGGRIAGTIENFIVMGGVIRHFVRSVDASPIIIQELNSPGEPMPQRGSRVFATWAKEHVRLLPPADPAK